MPDIDFISKSINLKRKKERKDHSIIAKKGGGGGRKKFHIKRSCRALWTLLGKGGGKDEIQIFWGGKGRELVVHTRLFIGRGEKKKKKGRSCFTGGKKKKKKKREST